METSHVHPHFTAGLPFEILDMNPGMHKRTSQVDQGVLETEPSPAPQSHLSLS